MEGLGGLVMLAAVHLLAELLRLPLALLQLWRLVLWELAHGHGMLWLAIDLLSELLWWLHRLVRLLLELMLWWR